MGVSALLRRRRLCSLVWRSPQRFAANLNRYVSLQKSSEHSAHSKVCFFGLHLFTSQRRTRNWHERVVNTIGRMEGEAALQGTRIPVSLISGSLASGASADDLQREFPDLTPEDVAACLSYAQDPSEFEGAAYCASLPITACQNPSLRRSKPFGPALRRDAGLLPMSNNALPRHGFTILLPDVCFGNRYHGVAGSGHCTNLDTPRPLSAADKQRCRACRFPRWCCQGLVWLTVEARRTDRAGSDRRGAESPPENVHPRAEWLDMAAYRS